VADEWALLDDGTIDTVIECPRGHEIRFSDTGEYRDEHSGALDFERFIMEEVLENGGCDECEGVEEVLDGVA
jgi:hypothetical protein